MSMNKRGLSKELSGESLNVQSLVVTTTFSLNHPRDTDELLRDLEQSIEGATRRNHTSLSVQVWDANTPMGIKIELNNASGHDFVAPSARSPIRKSDRIRISIRIENPSTNVEQCFKIGTRTATSIGGEIQALWESTGTYSLEFEAQRSLRPNESTYRSTTAEGFKIEIFRNKIRVRNIPENQVKEGIWLLDNLMN